MNSAGSIAHLASSPRDYYGLTRRVLAPRFREHFHGSYSIINEARLVIFSGRRARRMNCRGEQMATNPPRARERWEIQKPPGPMVFPVADALISGDKSDKADRLIPEQGREFNCRRRTLDATAVQQIRKQRAPLFGNCVGLSIVREDSSSTCSRNVAEGWLFIKLEDKAGYLWGYRRYSA